jgi:anti-anti-sigma factor
VDTAGLGALVSLYETANQPGKRDPIRLCLTNPTPSVRQMLELTRLHHLFEIAPPDDQPRTTPATHLIRP